MKESRLRSAVSALIDMIWAGLLWLLCSLPLFTLGASTTARYYTIVKSVRHDRSRVSRCFFSAFRSNFRQATLLWLLLVAELGAFVLIVWLLPPLLPLLPGAFCLLMSLSIEPAFRPLTADRNEGDAWYNE